MTNSESMQCSARVSRHSLLNSERLIQQGSDNPKRDILLF